MVVSVVPISWESDGPGGTVRTGLGESGVIAGRLAGFDGQAENRCG